MIFNAFILIASSIIGWIVNFFPVSTGYPAEVVTLTQTVGEWLWAWDILIPIADLQACLALVLLVQLAIFSFRSGRWLASHIPFVGGRG